VPNPGKATTHQSVTRFLPAPPSPPHSLYQRSLQFYPPHPMSYSSFFSSGLSAIQHLTPPSSPTQPVRPDSPVVPPTPIREAADISNEDQTPTPTNPFQAFGTERPKLRKRRSSLTVNTSPLVQFKGSYRGATAAVQRQNRSRSGSVNDFSQSRSTGFATEETNIIGRLRSGSIGNSLRCSSPVLYLVLQHVNLGTHRSRRIIRGARPPPSTPLPPLPTLVPSSAPHLGSFDLGAGTAQRRPLMSRVSTMENVEQAIPNSPAVFHELNARVPFKPMVNGPDDVFMKEI